MAIPTTEYVALADGGSWTLAAPEDGEAFVLLQDIRAKVAAGTLSVHYCDSGDEPGSENLVAAVTSTTFTSAAFPIYLRGVRLVLKASGGAAHVYVSYAIY